MRRAYIVWIVTEGSLAGMVGTIQETDRFFPANNPQDQWHSMGRFAFEGYTGTPLQPSANVSFDVSPSNPDYVDASTIVPI